MTRAETPAFPFATRQEESVCAQASETEAIAMRLTSSARSSLSSAEKPENKIFTANPENRYSPTAHTAPRIKVTEREYRTPFFRSFSPCAEESLGMTAAAIP